MKVALTGAEFEADLDGEPVPPYTSVAVPAGAVLTVGKVRTDAAASGAKSCSSALVRSKEATRGCPHPLSWPKNDLNTQQLRITCGTTESCGSTDSCGFTVSLNLPRRCP